MAITTTRHVEFHHAEIIELPIILGDHPATASDPPLTIGWKAQRRTVFNVDFYEAHRPKRQRDLVISSSRRQLL
jgi:hypothetical protein